MSCVFSFADLIMIAILVCMYEFVFLLCRCRAINPVNVCRQSLRQVRFILKFSLLHKNAHYRCKTAKSQHFSVLERHYNWFIMLNKSDNCGILEISGFQVLSTGQLWPLVFFHDSITFDLPQDLKTRGPALCLPLGSTTFSSSVIPIIYSANFNWLFADTKYLLDLNNKKLENIWEPELCKLRNFGNISANVFAPCRKIIVFFNHDPNF